MSDVKLLVNDKEIPLKEVMKSILTNVIDGFISALNDVPEDKKIIEIKINL